MSMFGFFNRKRAALPPESKAVPAPRFTFFDVGFHGDQYLLKVVKEIASRSEIFIEAGSNVGTTLSYFARTYPTVQCIACEPDPEAFAHATKNAAHKNVTIFNELSQDFIKRLKKDFPEVHNKACTFWIDSHGYGFEWPLIEEMQYILESYTSFYVLIDDFLVPGVEEFGYDVYQDQICSHDFIAPHLPQKKYYLYYPTYKEKTSKHHPLRGWGLYSSERIDWEAKGINFVREVEIN